MNKHQDRGNKTIKDFYVVGIGASAGGLDAIQQLFDHVPEDTGMAFVIIQHLSPDFKSLMPELLAKHTKMKIFTAADKQTIKPNCIYLNQRNKNLHIKGSELYLLDKGPKHNLNLPIDIFFHTLGEELKEKSIGIILSGTGSDGSRGIKTIKEAGGTIIVQDPSSAQFDGMPNSSISTNLVDFILPPGKIADALIRFPNTKLHLTDDENDIQSNDVIFYNILEEIHKFSGIDFRQYKRNTLIRRLEKRMSINNIDRIFDYHTFLKSNYEEKEILKQDFLIGVTSFFRDLEAFETLKNNVIPEICKNKKDTEPIRIWAAACSTGEETYSIAILLDEYIRTHKYNFDFKIFATDVDARALNAAGIGSFHINISNELEKKYLENYFLKTGDKIQIIKRIREKIVFSNHNILKDPPFIRMDLISCRNMLIYFDNKAQARVMQNFQFSLNKYGFLFLGNSESLGVVSKLFRTIDSKWKIYQNISDIKQISPQNNPENRISTYSYKSTDSIISHPEYRFKENPETIFHKYLSKKHSPASIFIDSDYNILFIKGDAGKKLSHSEGIFQNNLLKMVSVEIASIIQTGIRRVENEKKDVIITDIINEVDGQVYTFDLSFHKPVENDNINRCYLLQFSEEKKHTPADTIIIKNVPIDEISKQRFNDIENELKATKTELQNVVEELETSNEELQSSNEELMASNEELQSTNEELQSVNEELYTVNSELQEKNKELLNINNDVTNLLNSTDIGTLFLDNKLRIRKYTPALHKHFKLEETDIGRPISSFSANFDEETRTSIIIDSNKSLKSLSLIQKEIVDLDGNSFLKRISPFITIDNKIDGVVISFVDINDLKKKEKALLRIQEELTKSQQLSNMGSWHLDLETNEVTWTEELYKMYGFDPKLPPPPYYEHMNLFTQKSWKNLSDAVSNTKNTGEPYKLELEIKREDGTPGWMMAIGEAIKDSKGKIVGLRGAAQNITERKKTEFQLRDAQEFAQKITDLSPAGIYIYNFEKGCNEFMNAQYTEILGYSMDEINEMEVNKFLALFHPDDLEGIKMHMHELTTGASHVKIEYRFKHKNGNWVWCYSIDSPFKINKEGKVLSFIGVFVDITELKETEIKLKIAKKQAESANIHKNYFLANMSHEIRTPMNGVVGFSSLLRDESLSKETKEKYINIIETNSNQLLNLIDDIIDVAKIESNELKISLGSCNVLKMLTDILDNFNEIKSKLKNKEIGLKLEIPTEYESLIIRTDCGRLEQIIINLLNNALKFSEKGTVRFGFTVKKNNLEFFVSDEGIGIPKQKLTEIFERFKQLNYEKSAKYGGTGLGLAISKGFVQLLGGEIFVDSKIGKGSTFKFTIPLNKTDETKLAMYSNGIGVGKNHLNNKKLLIVDDEELIQLFFKEILKPFNLELLFAKNGKEAVDLYKTRNDLDIILMDLSMPEMNGFKATKAILELNPKAKIIAQTAYAMEEEKDKCLQSGFIDYIAKPIKTELLFEKMNKWLKNGHSS